MKTGFMTASGPIPMHIIAGSPPESKQATSPALAGMTERDGLRATAQCNMKVLFVSRKYPPSIGGMQRLSYHLITQMTSRVQARAITWGRSQIGLPLFVAYALPKALILTARGADLVHIGDPILAPIGYLVSSLLRIPTVITVHGLDVTFPLPAYQWIIPKLLRRHDRVVCISQQTRRACIERGIAPERCVTIHPGVSVPTETPSRAGARKWLEKTLGLSLHEDVVLLTVGRVVPRKGVAWFVESIVPKLMASEKRFHYVVVGRGPQEEQVRGLISHEGMNNVVHLLGQVSEADLSSAYVAADLFIMPNIRVPGDMEGFGLVALEAGAHGLPVLAADLEGIRDAIIPGQSGILLPSEDMVQWTECILTFLNDPSKLQDMGRVARATVQERFSWTHMVDEYEALFQETLRLQSPPGQ